MIPANQPSRERVAKVGDFDRTREYIDGVSDEEIGHFDRVTLRALEKGFARFHIELDRRRSEYTRS